MQDPNQQGYQQQQPLYQQPPAQQGAPAPAVAQPASALVVIAEAEEVKTLSTVIADRAAFARHLVLQAKGVIDPYIAAVNNMDFKQYPNESLTEVDNTLADLQGRINAATKKIDEAYLPMSRAFDGVIKIFTGEKKELDKLKELAQYPRKKIALEIHTRATATATAEALALNKKQEEIDFATASASHMMACMFNVVNETKRQILRPFFELTGDQFELYCTNLIGLDPYKALAADTVGSWVQQFVWTFKFIEPRRIEIDLPLWQKSVGDQIKPYQDWMISLLPMRRAQLAAGQPDNSKYAEWMAQIDGATVQAATHAVETIQQQGESQKTNNAFQAAATTTVPQQSEGTKINSVYDPSTPAHWIALVMNYATEQMPHFSDAECRKKFGFILTWTNTVLKATGKMVPGDVVPFKDDISTRAKAFKAK